LRVIRMARHFYPVSDFAAINPGGRKTLLRSDWVWSRYENRK